eukprot:UN06171
MSNYVGLPRFITFHDETGRVFSVTSMEVWVQVLRAKNSTRDHFSEGVYILSC